MITPAIWVPLLASNQKESKDLVLEVAIPNHEAVFLPPRAECVRTKNTHVLSVDPPPVNQSEHTTG